MYGRVSRALARTKAVPASGAPSATAASTRRSVSDSPSLVAGYSRLSRSNASPRNRSSPSRVAAMADRYLPNIDVEKEAGAPTDWKVVSSTGDATHWDISVQGPSSKTAEQLLGNFGQALERQATWTATATSAATRTADTPSRSWSFEDLEGRPWRGTLSVAPVKGVNGTYTARLVVSRGV